ncbi:MAG TPA: class I SAM-dependent methyltransferase, partial [Leptolyngbya sp.]|jgi:SAM-dependent methyltransferase|nr:class I SAM-dependent methyltransferase [Leptolyngbya sp.]
VGFRQATAEQTGLADQSVDLVTCFQSFHWFEPDATLEEFQRILKPSGRIALVWNTRDLSGDVFTQAYGEVIDQVSNQHPSLNRAEAYPESSPSFEEFRFASEQALDLPGLVGYSKSRSYVPTEGEMLDRLLQSLEALYYCYADDQGWVYMKYQTKVFIAGA